MSSNGLPAHAPLVHFALVPLIALLEIACASEEVQWNLATLVAKITPVIRSDRLGR